jgi:hypothetical protein
MNIDARVAGMRFDVRVAGMRFKGSRGANRYDLVLEFDAATGAVRFGNDPRPPWVHPKELDGVIDALTEWRNRHKERTRSKARRARKPGRKGK